MSRNFVHIPNNIRERTASLITDEIYLKDEASGDYKRLKHKNDEGDPIELPDYAKDNTIDFTDTMDGKTVIDKKKVETESISLQKDVLKRVQIGGTLPDGKGNDGRITVSDGENQVKFDTVGIQVIPPPITEEPQYTLLYGGLKETVQKLEDVNYLTKGGILMEHGSLGRTIKMDGNSIFMTRNRVDETRNESINLLINTDDPSLILTKHNKDRTYFRVDRITRSFAGGPTTDNTIFFQDLADNLKWNSIQSEKTVAQINALFDKIDTMEPVDISGKQDVRDYLNENNISMTNLFLNANYIRHGTRIMAGENTSAPTKTDIFPGSVSLFQDANSNPTIFTKSGITFGDSSNRTPITYQAIHNKLNEPPPTGTSYDFLTEDAIEMRDGAGKLIMHGYPQYFRHHSRITVGESVTGGQPVTYIDPNLISFNNELGPYNATTINKDKITIKDKQMLLLDIHRFLPVNNTFNINSNVGGVNSLAKATYVGNDFLTFTATPIVNHAKFHIKLSGYGMVFGATIDNPTVMELRFRVRRNTADQRLINFKLSMVNNDLTGTGSTFKPLELIGPYRTIPDSTELFFEYVFGVKNIDIARPTDGLLFLLEFFGYQNVGAALPAGYTDPVS